MMIRTTRMVAAAAVVALTGAILVAVNLQGSALAAVKAQVSALVDEPPGGSFTGLAPARLLDTRFGIGGPAGIVPANGSRNLTVGGVGGVPASGVSSVVLNVTVTRSTGAGFVTVYPTGATKPNASNLNFKTGQTVANMVVAGLGTLNRLTLFTSAFTHLLADVTGYFSTAATASDHAGLFHPLPPARIADSRTSFGFATPGPNVTRTLSVTGAGGIPASGVSAVVLNTTVAGPTAAGYVTVYPFGQPKPATSTINFAKGNVRANRTIVAIGTDGKISLFNATGSTPLIVDVVGWFSDSKALPDAGGAYFVPMTPVRVMDTRFSVGDVIGPIHASENETFTQTIATRGGMPSGNGNVFPVAVVGNLTAVAPTTAGFLTAYTPGFNFIHDGVASVSDVNFAKSDVVPNMIVTQLHPGLLGLYCSAGATHVILDVSGYFGLPVQPLTLTQIAPDANDQVFLDMSGNGDFYAAVSWASNLVPGDTNGVGDAFVINEAGNATRVSVSSNEVQANNLSGEAVVSNDGRYVAFTSYASNLVPGDTNNQQDVFVRDTAAATTTRINVGPLGAQADNLSSDLSISNDGSKVAFRSLATTLVTGDTNGSPDVFVADIAGGTVTRVSVDSAEVQGNGYSTSGIISGDGGHVAFVSYATNLVPFDTNTVDDLFVRDLAAGTTTRESVNTDEEQAIADLGNILDLSISDDGNVVVFSSRAANLVESDTNEFFDVFIRNRSAGGTTTRISAPGGIQANGYGARISGDGSTIAFSSSADTLSGLWSDSFGNTLYIHKTITGAIMPIRGYDYLSGTSLTTDGTEMLAFSDVVRAETGVTWGASYRIVLPT